MSEHLHAGATVLDFGSGNGSPVRALLEPTGAAMVEYDPFFRPDPTALERRYNLIVASEVVEHFHWPGLEFARLDRLLAPGGRLGVMTQPLDDDVDFARWWYVRDPTHVAFYAPETLDWIAGRFGWSMWRPSRTVILFDKRPPLPR